MATDPVKEKRDAILDELKKALDTWYKKETKKIDAEVAFVKSVIKARSAGAGLAKANAATGKVLVLNDITSFLAGE